MLDTAPSNAKQDASTSWGWIARVIALTLAYSVAGRLALLLAIPPSYAAPVWPSAGIALVAMLMWGYRVWPGILLGSFLVNVWTALDSGDALSWITFATVASIGLGAVLQSAIGSWLVRRTVGSPFTLIDEREIVKFLSLSGPVACLIGSTWGVTTLAISGIVEPGTFTMNWFAWWAGDALGVITCVPVLLVCFGRPRSIWRPRWQPVALPIAAMFVVAVLAYLGSCRWEQQQIEEGVARRATDIAHVFRRQLKGHLSALDAIVGLYESQPDVMRTGFAVFTKHLVSWQSGIQALEWIPRVPHSEREAYEQRGRNDGINNFRFMERNSDGTLVAAAQRDEYFPVYYVEPRAGNEAAIGFDLASSKTRL